MQSFYKETTSNSCILLVSGMKMIFCKLIIVEKLKDVDLVLMASN